MLHTLAIMRFSLDTCKHFLYRALVSPKLYNTRQAAKEAGISRVTLQEWVRRGIVRAPKLQIRHGRAVRLWTASDVVRLKSVEVPMGRPKKSKSKD